MGYWASTHSEVVITDVVGPGPHAVHKRHEFIPDSNYHYSQIADLYKRSGRLHTYLGDWHTHLNANDNLSRKDWGTIRNISKSPSARAQVPLMGILVAEPEWSLGVWCFFPRPLRSVWRSRALRFRLVAFSDETP